MEALSIMGNKYRINFLAQYFLIDHTKLIMIFLRAFRHFWNFANALRFALCYVNYFWDNQISTTIKPMKNLLWMDYSNSISHCFCTFNDKCYHLCTFFTDSLCLSINSVLDNKKIWMNCSIFTPWCVRNTLCALSFISQVKMIIEKLW